MPYSLGRYHPSPCSVTTEFLNSKISPTRFRVETGGPKRPSPVFYNYCRDAMPEGALKGVEPKMFFRKLRDLYKEWAALPQEQKKK